MMGQSPASQNALFYDFCLEKHIPEDHLLRQIDQFLDFDQIRQHLQPFYSTTGRPSIDPELMIRMLLVGYCYGIRSERRLCEEVNFNLAYRWFCRLGLDGKVPDHSTFSRFVTSWDAIGYTKAIASISSRMPGPMKLTSAVMRPGASFGKYSL